MTFRIELAGSIAVGKSTLCEQLEARGFEIIRENLSENPYLLRTYLKPASRGFDVQMAFLLSKASAIETYAGPSETILCDYALVTEYAYAQMHLEQVDAESYRICKEAIDLKRRQIGEPDLLIALSCPLDVQMDRIRQRGRAFEQSLGRDYLDRLNGLIAAHFNNGAIDQGRLLTIDTHIQDLRDSAVIDNLIGQIENIKNSDVKNYTNKAALRP